MNFNQEQFFEKYNIIKPEFEAAGLSWESLLEIYEEYLNYKETLKPTAEYISNTLRTHPDAHTVRSRIKDPEHLIDKIIRKTIREKEKDSNYKIDINNYKTEITDLIGIRVLHLYKDQAAHIDGFIRKLWNLKEKCTIYYREGDYSRKEEHEDSEYFEFKVHKAGYRSWHYLISTQATKEENIAEIQVRTIFEEGWSEIDHQLRYPNDINNMLLTKQLLVLVCLYLGSTLHIVASFKIR
ncbi:GTP pyrophosphokinase [Priestia megaterium]|uniref:GTP pyrophosphokinase n=1 Tax=Priestia megaterium TaxID=1404 RepID=UPI000BFAADB3|nr:GTP pyrophosphokinase [Priestia megaterium]PFK02423.1 GTP pyrophosphokinase [Priestia megaterium]PMD07713.1 GTP pyrophosphokinase [Priestia megaterium]